VILPVWYEISRWLGRELVSHSSILGSFVGMGSSKIVTLGLLLIWLAVVWAVWNSRIDHFFGRDSVCRASSGSGEALVLEMVHG